VAKLRPVRVRDERHDATVRDDDRRVLEVDAPFDAFSVVTQLIGVFAPLRDALASGLGHR